MTRNLAHRIATCEYSCGHALTFYDSPPRLNDTVLCRICRKKVDVVKIDLRQWMAVCKDCKYQTGHGLHGKLSSERSAVKHRKRVHFQHAVDILDPDGNLIHRFDSRDVLSLDEFFTSDDDRE